MKDTNANGELVVNPKNSKTHDNPLENVERISGDGSILTYSNVN